MVSQGTYLGKQQDDAVSSGTYLGAAIGGKQDDMMSEGSYMVRQDKSFIDDARSGVTAMGKIDEVS